ncbi:unnamed protein product [Ceutorhynchus assimilis]|uniref:Uncharacterized protein n=1 Tax=Ceutorhynchus assimilis TaxID=467358 RepID=A0A9N9MFR0_9CUCU|nr:unnamed protein product [Ceutorhynchus assimilis]
MKNHRDTQTYFMRNRKVPTRKLNVSDKLLTPGPYETAEKREIRLEGKVKIIQRYFRAWQIKMRMKALRLESQRQIDFEAECDEVELQQMEAIRKKDIITKVFPVKGEDFSMLFNMVSFYILS